MENFDINVILQYVHFKNLYWIFIIPAAMMGIDILTGLIKAWIANDFQSSKMRSGLGKKAGEMAIIAIGLLFTAGMGIPDYILSGISLYIIFMELMSVLENLDKLGVPIPAFIAKTLNNVNDSLQHDDYKALNEKIAAMELQLQMVAINERDDKHDNQR